ncbi:ionotropic receptor 75a-like [Vespula pensylvanica]|uniref:ionotropic receptor 75a-like n=1 Tax=Vespula pensylvanica TaxID=30213 RepID=UPI001CB9EBB7|nr:ionotropic receptor 75a-like [Vespula pensylvanica]
MSIRVLILLYVVLHSYAEDNDFISDYFAFKNVKNIVGFSCGDVTSNFNLLRKLNHAGVFAIIKDPFSNPDVRLILNSDHWAVGVFVDLRCHNENLEYIFSESSEHRMYGYLYSWLILGSNLNQSISILNDTAYSMATDVVVAIPNQNGYEMYDVFNHCKYRGGLLNVIKYGTWNPNGNLTIYLMEPKLIRRGDLNGLRLKIAGVIQYRPKNMRLIDYMKDINTRSLESMHKFVYSMISHTGDLFNFSVHAGEIYYWDRNSIHGRMFELLKDNYIDIASNPRVMVSERLEFASLIGAAWPVRPCFMLLSTPTNKIKLDLFLKPFTAGIWDTYVVFMIISMIIVGLILKREKVKSEEGFGAIVLTIGIMSQQGAYLFPKNLAGRIAVVQILLFSWMMYNYYSCSIVSARLSEPFDKIEDSVAVLADTHMRIAAEAVPYLNYLLKKWNWESDYFRKKRWDPLPLSKRYLPIEEGIRQVGQGILAYHTDPNTAYPYIEKMFDSSQICQLTEIHLFKESVMGMYSSHNAQFLEIARVGLIKMQSSGLRNRQIKYWSSKKPQCQQDALSTRSITIYETASAFILLTLGILMSSVICLTENIYYHRFTQKFTQQNENFRLSKQSSNQTDNANELQLISI